MISELRTAIVNKAVTVSGVSASNVFYSQATDNKTGLYIVFTGVPYDRAWDSAAKSDEVPVQFNFYCSTLATLESAVFAFAEIFDFGSLTIASPYTFVACLPAVPTLPATKLDDIWQAVLTYNIEVTRLRS